MIRPNKEVVVMRLNKQLPINTIQQQIKTHLKIQIEAQIAREQMVVQMLAPNKKINFIQTK